MTTWPARIVRRRDDVGELLELMCGRQVAGRYVCQGEIGLAVVDRSARNVWTSPGPGMTEDPPGSRHWRKTSRRIRVEANARAGAGAPGEATARRLMDHARHRWGGQPTGREVDRFAAVRPWTRHCPACNVLASVTDDLLESLLSE